jgi:hypothetical protein
LCACNAGFTEVGSAAFRCIACNRPLPSAAQWNIDRANAQTALHHDVRLHHDTRRSPSPRQKRRELQGGPQHEVVMRGGFPMVNPKIRPNDRRVAPQLRLFGKNMRSLDESLYSSLSSSRHSTSSHGTSRRGRGSPAASTVSGPLSRGSITDSLSPSRYLEPLADVHGASPHGVRPKTVGGAEYYPASTRLSNAAGQTRTSSAALFSCSPCAEENKWQYGRRSHRGVVAVWFASGLTPLKGLS